MSKPPPAVGHTCIAIDKALAHAHSSIPDFLALEEMKQHLEAVRRENIALRARLAWFEKRAR